jgi:hypothetical protein
VQRLLIVDWAPHVREGDKILYIFDCGDLGTDETRIQLASASWTDGNGYQPVSCPIM